MLLIVGCCNPICPGIASLWGKDPATCAERMTPAIPWIRPRFLSSSICAWFVPEARARVRWVGVCVLARRNRRWAPRRLLVLRETALLAFGSLLPLLAGLELLVGCLVWFALLCLWRQVVWGRGVEIQERGSGVSGRLGRTGSRLFWQEGRVIGPPVFPVWRALLEIYGVTFHSTSRVVNRPVRVPHAGTRWRLEQTLYYAHHLQA